MKSSIIIPTFNRSFSLRNTIESLLNSKSSPHNYEIIIVDNASTDSTKQLAESIIRLNPQQDIRYYYEPIPGSLSARHKGALESKGDILIFIDDDIVAASEWLEAIIETFNDPAVHLVGGKSLPMFDSQPPEWLEAFWFREMGRNWCAYLSILDFGDQLAEIDPIYVWSLNYAIRRETLFELGGFHPDYVPKPFEQYQGDGETGLAWKVQAKGLKIMYQPRALVHHIIPDQRLTIEYFEKRMFFGGIFDSYTTIRRNQGMKFNWKMQEPFPQIKRTVNRVVGKLSGDPHAQIKQRVRGAWLEGYKFHQREVRQDSALLMWVLQNSYFDYRYGPFRNNEPSSSR
jgi:glycosyltransferase involved in cell wall biosynthesis